MNKLPTSGTGCSNPLSLIVMRQAGFTLIELLVALAILAIGLAAGIGLLRPDPRQSLNAESEKLALLLEQASEEIELAGTPIAWLALANGYAFERQSHGPGGMQWRPLSDDQILRPRQFPDGLVWTAMRADGSPIELGSRISLDERGPLKLELRLAYGEAHTQVIFSQGRANAQPAQIESPR